MSRRKLRPWAKVLRCSVDRAHEGIVVERDPHAGETAVCAVCGALIRARP